MKKTYSLIVIPKMNFPMFLDRKIYAVIQFYRCSMFPKMFMSLHSAQRVGTDPAWASTLGDA